MSSHTRKLKSILSRLARVLPNSLLAHLEEAARVAQGKGWGADTVSAETQAALHLMPPSTRRAVVAVDVGANVGNWTASLLESNAEAQVFCFEPSQSAFEHLQRRFRGDPRVVPINAGLSDREGMSTLWADAPGSGLGSLSKRKLDHFGIGFGHNEEVSVVSLDAWIGKAAVKPNLLKIDVEGHEMSVLVGASAALEAIEVVQFEFGGCNIDSRSFFQDFFYFFEAKGFRLWRLGPKGLRSVSKYTEIDEAFTTTNYFAQRKHP